MKSLYLLLFSLLIGNCVIGQGTYQKNIQVIRYEPRGYKAINPFSAHLSSEGTYHLGFYEESFNNTNSSSPTIFKLSNDGEIEWMKYYTNEDYLESSVGFRGDGLSDVIPINNNEFISCLAEDGRGRSFDGISSVFLSFDKDGNELWDNVVFGRVRSNLIINDRKNILFSHWLFSSDTNELLLVEMNKDGEIADTKRITASVVIYKLLKTKDGNIFFIAYDQHPNFNGWINSSLYFSPLERSYIGKMDENYNLIWMKTVSNNFPVSVKETLSGELVLSSFSKEEEFSYVTKLSASGEEIWSKFIPLSGGSITDNININSKGEIILLSNTNLTTFDDLAYLSAINPIGEILWTRVLPTEWTSY
ncbi:MAG: hypothetical protein AAGG68_03855 [Bacteroidota bacterium]